MENIIHGNLIGLCTETWSYTKPRHRVVTPHRAKLGVETDGYYTMYW